MTKTVLGRAAALAAATMLALTACGGAEEAPEETPAAVEGTTEEAPAEETTEVDPPEDAAAEGEGASDAGGEEGAAAGAGEGAVVEIGTEFTDEETGDVITVVSAMRDMPTEYYEAVDNPDGEMIYLEVSVVPGDQFGGVVSQSSFFLDDGGEPANYASSADDELIAAGNEYFDGPARRDGEATGFIPIYVGTTADTLTGSYVREEMKILGEDTTIPEFTAEFEIPAA